jgi:hypothetical protein
MTLGPWTTAVLGIALVIPAATAIGYQWGRTENTDKTEVPDDG